MCMYCLEISSHLFFILLFFPSVKRLSKDKNNLILCITAIPLVILILMPLNIYHLFTTFFYLIVHIVGLYTKAQGQINIVNLVLS